MVSPISFIVIPKSLNKSTVLWYNSFLQLKLLFLYFWIIFFWIAVPAVVIVNGANTFFGSGNQKFVNQLKHLKQQIIHWIEFFSNYFRNVFNNFKLAEKWFAKDLLNNNLCWKPVSLVQILFDDNLRLSPT